MLNEQVNKFIKNTSVVNFAIEVFYFNDKKYNFSMKINNYFAKNIGNA